MAEIKKRKLKNNEYSYTVSIRLKGMKSEHKTFKRITDAKEWASKRETELREKINFPHRVTYRMTVSDLIDLFIEKKLPQKTNKMQKEYLKALNWFKNEIGYLYLRNVTTTVLSDCRDKLATKKKEMYKRTKDGGKFVLSSKTIAPATVNHYLVYLSGVFTYAVKELEILTINPVYKVEKLECNNARTRCLTQEEINLLLTKAKEYSIELFLCTLMALLESSRKSEIITLTWKNVDFTHKMLYFLDTKNGEPKGVPMSEDLYRELKSYYTSLKVRKLKDDYVFANRNGNPRVRLIEKDFPKLIKECGIEDYVFHDNRHTSASWQAMEGVSQAQSQKILGHKTSAMTNRYSHLRAESLRNSVNIASEAILAEWKRNL